MSEPTATRTVTVTNADGIHMRAAMVIAELVRRFDCLVTIVKGDQRAEGSDILQILALFTQQGEQLQVEATGREAEEAAVALGQLFASGLDNGDSRGT